LTPHRLSNSYLHLQDYLRKYPDADEQAYPPFRRTWVPQKFIATMQTFVKPLEGEHDHGAPPAKATKRRETAIKKGRGGGRAGAKA
jgi:hypothetical protein